MGAQAWVVAAIAVVAGAFVARKMWRQFQGKEKAGCDKCSDTTAHKH